jgi:hypothetical protein
MAGSVELYDHGRKCLVGCLLVVTADQAEMSTY